MKKLILIYFTAGLIWYVYAKVIQGYAVTWTDVLLWPKTAYAQFKSQNSVAT